MVTRAPSGRQAVWGRGQAMQAEDRGQVGAFCSEAPPGETASRLFRSVSFIHTAIHTLRHGQGVQGV